MQQLATIHQRDVFPDMAEDPGIEYVDRNTGKAVVFDKEGNIGLVGNLKNEFFQLPGGGIDDGEEIKNGIIRECLEEIGCKVELVRKVGVIHDFRPRDKKHCINFCYVAKVIGEKGDYTHTKDEADIGMYTKWVRPEEALNIFKKQKEDLEMGRVNFYNTGFNIVRDAKFLEEVFSNNLHNV